MEAVQDWTVKSDNNDVHQTLRPGDIVQPCNNVEILMAKAGLYDNQTSVQAIWLEGKQPIDPQKVERALWILARRIPHLRFCLTKSKGKFLFRLMKNFVLDFEVVAENVMEIFHKLLNSSFDLINGPLWKARLIQNQEETVLLFSLQHCITDGITNIRICKETVEILNHIIASRDINSSLVEPLTLSPRFIDTYQHISKPQFLVSYYCKKIIDFFKGLFRPYDGLQRPLHSKDLKHARTKVIFHDFTEDETKSLLLRCKSANITMNSLMTTLVNASLLAQIKKKNSSSELKRKIRTIHCVNLRRHLDPEYSETPGCMISWLEDEIKMSLGEILNNVWLAAKQIHQKLLQSFEKELTHLKVIPIIHHCGFLLALNYHLSNMGLRNKVEVDYVSTNLGKIDQILQPQLSSVENSIQITRMIRSASSHFGWSPFVFAFHTFRKKLSISIDYFTNKVSEKDIEDLFQLLCMNTRKLAFTGVLSNPIQIKDNK